MNQLLQKINHLRNSEIKEIVDNRLKEFESFKTKPNENWFSELCFCILTANSRAKTGIAIQNQLKPHGFINNNESKIRDVIKENKHRFHNTKAKFIVLAREHTDIKEKIQKRISEEGEKEAREFLVKNIKGIGMKEASHFLRNVGYTNLAILDRHILNLMAENGYIKEKPKSLNKKSYLEIEEKFNRIANETEMSLAELDLYMWYMKTGEVLK